MALKQVFGYVVDLSALDPALQEVLQNISADGYTLFKQKCELCGKMIGNMRRHMLVRTHRIPSLYGQLMYHVPVATRNTLLASKPMNR